MTQTHLFTDADNTLWDTNAVFADAQLGLLRDLESLTGRRVPEADDKGLAFLRRVDQRIAATHPERLRYPPALLAAALALALQGEDLDIAAEKVLTTTFEPDAYRDVVTRFLERLRTVPALRLRVKEGLKAAVEASVPITVLTEERLDRCRTLLSVHDLLPLVSDVVSLRKTEDAYHVLRNSTPGTHLLMVGDQLDRDIVPSHRAGFTTFFFPSGFVPYWNEGIALCADHKISRYDEVVPFLEP